jgi:hypothetical protein
MSSFSESSEGESYVPSDDDGESLGEEDTDIDENELDDLREDADTNMPPKKTPTKGRTRSPKKPQADVADVEELAENLKTSAVVSAPRKQPKCYSLSYRFPFSWNTAQDGLKEIVYLDFQTVNLPTSFLRMAKVLPGGWRFGLLMGSPKWFFEEGYLITQLGNDYDENLARVQSREATVVQPIRRMASGMNRFLPGDVQVIDLPFQCVEGDYAPQWGSWRTRDMEDVTVPAANAGDADVVHIQFQRSVTFDIVSVHDKVERLVQEAPQVFGFADGEN